MKKGNRVRHKFRLPKPGDECVTGTLLENPNKASTVKVEWDKKAPFQPKKQVVHVAILELIEREVG